MTERNLAIRLSVIEKAKKAASLQITDIQNPIAEAAQKESVANQKVIDDLKRQLLGLGNERQAFIDHARFISKVFTCPAKQGSCRFNLSCA